MTPAGLAYLPTTPPTGCPFDPPEGLVRLRREEPISRTALPDGSWAWLVTRHQDARAVLGDLRFSSDTTRPGYPLSGMTGGTPTAADRGFIRMDPPEHSRLRRMIMREFTVKRVEELRPDLQRITDELCDAMERSPERPVDLVRALALPMPSRVICVLLGVPGADHDLFQGFTSRLFSREVPEDVKAATREEFNAYLEELTAAKAADPGDDILSRLITGHEAAGELARKDVATFGVLLLIAGHDTTANMIGLSALSLMDDPELSGTLRRDPSLLPGAVEELLRFHSIIRNGPRRVALEDVEVGGQVIRAREGVIVSVPAANRDEDVFEDPDRFDIRRPGGRHHLAFGWGVHQCIGQALARAELEIVVATLLRRFPRLRPAVPLEDLRFRTDQAIYGCHSLPVTW
ncbi:cytochrome P450 [Streptomyces sp. ISL-11]|uniref:cytochrome P450 n=1 Tax=Streptomyces sp. ISL-11 TaxID=2819174 RepID=UPI001BE4F655|nr:cytochrome P450 [Streptomyces sp. ISL-11]MBT2382080.1 cytochrome P450 [Streptomyces sp. ISL-11]